MRFPGAVRAVTVALAVAWWCPWASAAASPPATDPASIEARTVAAFPPYRPLETVSGIIRVQGHGHVTRKWLDRLLNLWESRFRQFHPGVSLQQDMKGTSSAIPRFSPAPATLPSSVKRSIPPLPKHSGA